MKPIVILLALSFAFQVPALAQSPIASPRPVASPGAAALQVQFTAHEVAALLKAVKDAEASPDVTINVAGKDAAEMPAYDPLVHFAGLDGKGAATIWMSRTLQPKTKAAAYALFAAMELACMATGFAGPHWKAIYDQVAAADSAQPANAPNPYQYRLALTSRIQAIVDSYVPAATGNPSPSPYPR
ncbi:MAG TPA: hypothetical protein VHT92_11695 [Candidatus Cybelea sp.]|jgi:hypothetical protein|nr:hypothetical protein [Candidatus Cybelea sp.]